MKLSSIILTAVLVLALASTCAARPFLDMPKPSAPAPETNGDRDVAETIWFQGFLADKVSGDPIEGEHVVEIAILDAEVLGNEIWGPEAHDETFFSAGWFTVEMGIDEPLPTLNDPPYYLEISVDGEIFDPRIRMASVPFAFHANTAETSDSAWIVDGNVMYPATAETVGIGTTRPLGQLHVHNPGGMPQVFLSMGHEEGLSGVYFIDTLSYDDFMILGKGGQKFFAPIGVDGADGKGFLITGYDSRGFILGTEEGPIDLMAGDVMAGGGGEERDFETGFMRLTPDGRVGVGTPEPDTTFHVVGTIKTEGFQMETDAESGYVLKSDSEGHGTWQPGGDSDGDWTVEGGTMYPATAETVVIGGPVGWAPLTVWGDGTYPNALFATTEEAGIASAMLSASGFGPACLMVGHRGLPTEEGDRQFGDPGKGFVLSGPEATGLQLISESGPISLYTDYEGGPRAGEAVIITEAGDVGIGTDSPDARLEVSEEGHMGMTVSSTDGWGSVTARLQAGSGLNDYLRMQHFGPTASGTMSGINLASRSVIQAGSGSKGMILATGTADTMYVLAGANEAMRVTPGGWVGVGTTTPSTRLDVEGGFKTDAFQMPTDAANGYVLTSDASGNASWEASAPTDNDWTMSGATMYPATAETIVIGATAGLGPLTVTGDGVLSQGTFYGGESEDASLLVFADDDIDNHLMLGVNALGPVARGERTLSGPGEAYLTSGPDNFGLQIGAEEGYIDFTLGADGPSRDIDAMRITADGKVGIGTTSPDTTLHVAGAIKTSGFQMPTGASNGYVLTSDASGNAVWDAPTVGSAGIVIGSWIEGATTAIGSSWTQYDNAQVSVTVPGSGYVMVTSSVHCLLNHTNGTEDHLQVGHTDDLGDAPTNYTLINHTIPSEYPTASSIDLGFTVSSMHEVTSSGTYTYYLVGRMSSGQDESDVFFFSETRAIYYPYTIVPPSPEQQAELEIIERKKAMANE